MRTRRRDSRGGFAMAVAVIALLLIGISVFSMLFFSGSQTRSLHQDLDGWQARELALSALRVAGDRLREGRWYGNSSLVGVLKSKVGRGGYVVVCEDMRRVKPGPLTWNGVKYDQLAVLDRIDVFARGFCGDRTCVMYGRFLMGPEPAFLGTSTNGLVVPRGGQALVETADTLKRMVRVTELRDKAHQHIEVRSVRDAIRWVVAGQSVDFVKNYAQVRWDAAPPAAPTTVFDPLEAAAVVEQYWGASSPDPGNQFMHDRLYDFLVEGTPVGQWVVAPGRRRVELDKDPPSSNRGLVMAAIAATGTAMVEYSPRVNFPPPSALDALHSDRNTGVASSDYHHDLSYNDKTSVTYDVKWSQAYGTQAEAEAAGGTWFEYGGQYYANVTVDGPNDVTRPYWVEDQVTGSTIRVDDVMGFFERYYQEGTSEALGDATAESFAMGPLAAQLADDSSEFTPGTTGTSWEDNPEIIIIPGPPEPLPTPSSGNTKGDDSVGNVIHVSSGSPGGGGSASGGW